MTEIVCKTVGALEAALADPAITKDDEIIVDSKRRIEIRGTRGKDVYVVGDTSVYARGTARLTARDNTSVLSEGAYIESENTAEVCSLGRGFLRAQDSSVGYVREVSAASAAHGATLYGKGSAAVTAMDWSHVAADDLVRVIASQWSIVEATGSSTIIAYGNVKVRATGTVCVHAHDAVEVEAGPMVVVYIHDDTVTVCGGIQIRVPKAGAYTARAWCADYLVPIDDKGEVRLYAITRGETLAAQAARLLRVTLYPSPAIAANHAAGGDISVHEVTVPVDALCECASGQCALEHWDSVREARVVADVWPQSSRDEEECAAGEGDRR